MAFDSTLEIIPGADVRLNTNAYIEEGFELGSALIVESVQDDEDRAVVKFDKFRDTGLRLAVKLAEITRIA